MPTSSANPINAKRMLKNTGMLYVRHLFILVINLLAVRFVLNALGAQDYGIYNVIAGIVVMCSFFCGTMASSSQRYFSIDLGRRDYDHLNQVFSLTILLYALAAGIFILLAETLGLWFINTHLTIPPARLIAANWIYQTAIFSFLFTLFATPYLALVISHEDMHIYAYISIAEAVLKLLIIFLLGFFPDKLIAYGVLMMGIAGLHLLGYLAVCYLYYGETKLHWLWNGKLFREILAFNGWNLFGTVSTIIKQQGTNILLNIFHGPLLNAAQGLAGQVRVAVSMFANNFSQAMRPQISKSYAVEQYQEMFRLVYIGSKTAYFLMLVIMVPLFYNMDYILSLWLKNTPPYTLIFVKLLMIESLIESLSQPMASVNQATGKIALYQTFIGIVVILNLPVAYILLKMQVDVAYIYVAGCILMGVVDIIRLIFLKRVPGFSFRMFCKQVLLPIVYVTLPAFLISKFVVLTHHSLLSLTGDVIIKAVVVCALVWLFGVTRNERQTITAFVKKYRKGFQQ